MEGRREGGREVTEGREGGIKEVGTAENVAAISSATY